MPEYYKVKCPYCHWIGMSDECNGGQQIADTGDYDDITCPYCNTVVEDIDDKVIILNAEETINDLRKKLSEKCKENQDLLYEVLGLGTEILGLNNPEMLELKRQLKQYENRIF